MTRVLTRKHNSKEDLWTCSRCAWTSPGYDIGELFQAFHNHDCAGFPRGRALAVQPKSATEPAARKNAGKTRLRRELQVAVSKKRLP